MEWNNVNSDKFYIQPMRPNVGYLVLCDAVKVAVKTKPDPTHLENMKVAFGWEWEDA